MIVYWLIFLVPSALALAARAPGDRVFTAHTRTRLDAPAVLALIALVIIVGLRYDTGGDWINYVNHQLVAQSLSLRDAVAMGDPAYWLLSVISSQLGLGIIGVNVVASIIFSIGLFIYCRSLPRQWLALAVATPYLVIVVGMGYVRQAIALSFFMLGLVALGRQSFRWFVIWVLIGAAFHKSAVAMIPLAALSGARNRLMTALFGGSFFVVGYFVFLSDAVDDLLRNYVEAEYQSAGALVRLALNFIPAVIFLLFRSRFPIPIEMRRLYTLYAFSSVALFLGVFMTSASTALDRFGLYMIPLQLFVFSYLPDVFGRRGRVNASLVMPIILLYASVLFVWLNYANNAFMWLPYRSALFF